MESGSDKVLRNIKKGNPQKAIFEAVQRMYEGEIDFGSKAILGLGGVEDSEEHVSETIRVLNEIKPSAIGFTVLNPQPGTPLYDDIKSGKFELPTYRDIIREEKEILEELKFDKPTYIWTGGFLPRTMPSTGYFPQDKERIIHKIQNRKFINSILDKKLMIGEGL